MRLVKIALIASYLILSEQLSGINYSEKLKESDNPDKYTISGHITDGKNGEALIGAMVSIKDANKGTVTNTYGYYSLTLSAGNYELNISYVGYKVKTLPIELKSNIRLDIELKEEATKLQEVVISTDKPQDKVKRAEMSVEHLEMKTIKKIPALLGEVDVIKAIQLLPGVIPASEGSSNFSVRGGNADQNLIQLDEATVYNPSHLLGFFSVFNNDAVKDVKLYKGDIPASSGGRLSSLVDVRMRDGDSKNFDATGGIGLISSRLTLEGPIRYKVKKDTMINGELRKDTVRKTKGSFLLAGRRTYVDLFFPLLSHFTSQSIKSAKLYFYDLNGKLNYAFGENDKVYISVYTGKDMYGNSNMSFGYGNTTFTLRWNHIYTPKLFSNLSLITSRYNYQTGNGSGNINSFLWTSAMNDYSLKLDYIYYLNTNNTIRFGYVATLHQLQPGDVSNTSSDTVSRSFHLDQHKALEHGLYLSNEQNLTSKLTVKYGIRLSAFQNIGRDYIYNYDSLYNAIDSTVYGKNKIFKTYVRLEPRLGINYQLNEVSSLKASYSRTAQYMQLASSSTSGTPLDIWFTASPNVKPQLADQFAVGYVRNLYHNALEASGELYYKKIHDLIDFKDNAQLLFNNKLDGELRYGTGYAYGAELMLSLYMDKTNGWISYTYSKSMRHVKGLSDLDPTAYSTYVSPFDKPNDVNIVLNQTLARRLSVSATWVYSTGAPITLPAGRWVYQGVIMPLYTSRNTYRMPDYNRLDLSITLKQKKRPFNLWDGEWVFSVYNVYDRHNTWAIIFQPDTNNPNVMQAKNIYLFGVIPAITYNFKF